MVVAAALSGCSDLRRMAGLDKKAPDEFTVVSRAPLAVPTEFDLPTPTPGLSRPQEPNPRLQAMEIILGKRPAPTADMVPYRHSVGELAFLRQAGTEAAIPDIRRIVNDENKALIEQQRTLADHMIPWRRNDVSGPEVDPEKEMTRLRENQALGRPTTEGDTPIIKRKKKALLEGLF
ncbi:MAG: DUF3035 domain-containing protein [Alphaproteobacteria bacterium]